MTIGKGGVVVDYDTRDNMFFPNKGTYGELEAQYARGGLGSDRDFDSYNLRVFTWLPLSKDFVLGLRGATKFTSGDVPFYAQLYRPTRGATRTLSRQERRDGRSRIALECRPALVGIGLYRCGPGLWQVAFV